MTNVSGPVYQLLNGSILVPELPGGEVVTAAVVATVLPGGPIALVPNTTALFVSALRSTLDSGGPGGDAAAAAVADYNAAVATGADALRAAHIAAWATIWTSGCADGGGCGCGGGWGG